MLYGSATPDFRTELGIQTYQSSQNCEFLKVRHPRLLRLTLAYSGQNVDG